MKPSIRVGPLAWTPPGRCSSPRGLNLGGVLVQDLCDSVVGARRPMVSKSLRNGDQTYEIKTRTVRRYAHPSRRSRSRGRSRGNAPARIQRIGRCQWHLQPYGHGIRARRTPVCLPAKRPVARHQKRRSPGRALSNCDTRFQWRTRIAGSGVRSELREQPAGLYLLPLAIGGQKRLAHPAMSPFPAARR